MVTIKQGESRIIWIRLDLNGSTLTPDRIADLEICAGNDFHKTYSSGGVFWDAATSRWYIFPTAEETMNMEADTHTVSVHLHCHDGQVLIYDIDHLTVKEHSCKGGS